MQVNLLQETQDIIDEHGRTTADVEWVGSKDGSFAISWDNFKAIADLEYDRSYGGTEIALDLVVVGNEWWLERHEYDGAEWWEFKILPTRAMFSKSFGVVFSPDKTSIAEIIEQVNHGR